ncbi:uncharacterized protein LOC113513022 isoform X2 [Galleria mellonella]|uniref:Uncharacterized protein LOC113513022 isoform X2 n=1 Tax=Galleria mellonella TaxID=7137 RepID=A0ABM3MH70_GALME|nr:uncharacterized protein LOC113513022 isoform X2 [Galleria mellonella]
MRSQATKPLPKKGALSKTTFKANSNTKQTKKKSVCQKKVKTLLNKTVVKNPKKNSSKDDIINNKNDGEQSVGENTETSLSPENTKAGPSKSSHPRSDSPTKKNKKEPKKKEDSLKNSQDHNVKKIVTKKFLKVTKKIKNVKPNMKVTETDNDVKYKINVDVIKKNASKYSKAKTVIKKGQVTNLKNKNVSQVKQEHSEKEQKREENEITKSTGKKDENEKSVEGKNILSDIKHEKAIETKSEEKIENKDINSSLIKISTNITSPSNPEIPKTETERPPKFFTSSRSPRTVDIDVKCFKNSKGNLSMSERFLSMKFETKSEDNTKDKYISNTLVSQGPEIDVYTFTEKVDSPKSILSDFRSPINKNVGRVRPIARVKGTIIDRKNDSEKKKYSPHRPIEEVVKQLKANKRSEECNSNSNQSVTSNENTNIVNDEKDLDDKPKPIISKSYKMVARKSSITGKPFSPTKFLEQEPNKNEKPVKTSLTKKSTGKSKKQKKMILSDGEIEFSKFALNTKSLQYTSSDESIGESNDDNDTKEFCESDTPKPKKTKTKKYKKTTDSGKKSTSKELKELSKDSHSDLKDQSILLGEKPSKRRLKLLSMWTGPKKHRMASLNAIAKVHCLYENESRTHMELGLMKTIDRQISPGTSKPAVIKKKDIKPKETEKQESTSESEYENRMEKKDESSESSDDNPPQRSLRGVPGIRSAGKYWDPKSSTSSSEDSELETKKKSSSPEKKKASVKSSMKSDIEKSPVKMKKTVGVPVKKKRNRNEIVMDLKDMVVQKRMASLNATAILAASYEKRSPKSSKDDSTSDSCSDESFSQKPKNGVSSGVKSETKIEEPKKEIEESSTADRKQKVEVIVNQDTDVTITGVYSTHHEGFCTAMQYRISSTSHTQTTATANCEKEGCSREDGSRYTPLSALSSMQPPAEHSHPHPHPVSELRRTAGCSSAFSAPSPSAHHEPGYYQPAGPLIKESGAEAERTLARYHPPPHYHAPHPPVLQQYGPPYYPAELCYSRYYRPPGPYHIPPPQPDAQMVGVSNEPYPPPQYYGTPPCYQHSPQRIPYVEYRQCPCPLNTCPKNVLIGPATGKAPTGGGPADVPSALAPPGGAFRAKVRACALDASVVPDTLAHGSGKDPPLEAEPPAAADAPRPCPLPAMGGASPKREIYDARDKLRRVGDMPVLGPPSPARGSAGVCAPQPPPVAPRRARLGKEMARRSLAGDDTGVLLSAPLAPLAHHSDADDDVLAISPPVCAPIDLSSSDERSTPLVDVKKENEGPTNTPPRKPDAQALREHNCTTNSDTINTNDTAKAVKRRHSKPKLEIDMKDTQLEDSCKTNGIGEHVKLQKRRKVSGEQTDTRSETVTKEPRKRASPIKRISKTSSVEKKTVKRKLDSTHNESRAKKTQIESVNEDPRLKNVAAVVEEALLIKPKTKSALLLDKLLRKNSIDRADAKGYSSDTELNPAELFLSPNENISQNCPKKTLNINNNIVDNHNAINGVRPNKIAAVNQLVGKKLPYKSNCKVDKVDSKITHNLKSVLKSPTAKSVLKEESNVIVKEKQPDKLSVKTSTDKRETTVLNVDISSRKESNLEPAIDKCSKGGKLSKPSKTRAETTTKIAVVDEPERAVESKGITEKRSSDASTIDRPSDVVESTTASNAKPERPSKRCKLSVEQKGKNVEKVVKLLVSKRPAIKTDDAVLVTEDACSSPTPPSAGRRARRRRPSTVLARRSRRPAAPLAPPALEPRAAPRWSNGWSFDGEHYISKVYLNNDSRLDRPARCWSRMSHASGDRVSRGDCVLLRASVARAQPFVARVASLWENPDDGEMMVSLVWYYRPEHTEHGRQAADAPDEVFASRHRDANSVACIEDKCYVLRYNEYCRYRKRLKAAEEGITLAPSIVPPMPASEVSPALAPNDSKLPLTVSPELVLFCRKVYDFRSKKIYVPNK